MSYKISQHIRFIVINNQIYICILVWWIMIILFVFIDDFSFTYIHAQIQPLFVCIIICGDEMLE